MLIPLALIKNMTKFKSASTLASVLILVALFSIFFYASYQMVGTGAQEADNLIILGGFPHAIGIIVFTFEGVGIFFDIRHSM